MTQDRVESDFSPHPRVPLLYAGVRRASVSEVAATCKSRLIDYHRGQITIRDRKGLEPLFV